MAEKVELFELTIDMDQAVKDLAASQKAVSDLKKELNELKKAEGDNSVAIAEKTAQLKAEEKQMRDNETVTKNVVTANNAATGSLEQMKAELAVVTVQYNKLSKEERENTEAGKQLAAQKLELTNRLKEAESATGNFTRNVGNYKDSIMQAVPAVGGFNASLLALAANPIVLIITAIVGALKLLYDAFKSTQNGSDSLNKVTLVLSATLQALQGLIAKVAEGLVAMVENPKQAIADFGNWIKEKITNVFMGWIELIPNIGRAIGLLFEGKFAEAGKVAVDSIAKITLGVENFSDKAINLFNEVTDAIEKSAAAALLMQKAQIALEEANIRATVSLAKLNKEAELYSAIADDNTRSFKERQEAAEKARIASEEAARMELELVKQEASVIALRNSQLEANGQLLRENRQEQADATAKVIDAEKNLLLVQQNNARQREEIDRDLFEKNLDYLLDNFDNVKTINERIANDEKKTFEERLGIIQATKALGDQAFADQIKQIQTRTDETINANDLLAESDSKRLLEKVRLLNLDEKEETRLLEVLRDRRTAIQDLADAEVSINDQKLTALQEAAIADQQRAYELAQDDVFQKLAIEQQRLDAQYQLEIDNANRIGADTSLIDAKYAKAKKEIAKAEFNAKAALANDFLGSVAKLAGEGTAIGKAAAVAQTSVSTFQAATGAYASLASIPIVGPGLGVAAAAAATVAGLANVKKILAVKSGLPGEGGVSASGASASVPESSSAASSVVRAATIAPDVNQGIVSRDTAGIGNNNSISLQPTLVTDDVTLSQKSEAARLKTATI